MSHGEDITVIFYLGVKPTTKRTTRRGITGEHVISASATKVWKNPPTDQEDMLVIPIELTLPEEAFLPTMPKVKVNIPIESIETDVQVQGTVKRIVVKDQHARKLAP